MSAFTDTSPTRSMPASAQEFAQLESAVTSIADRLARLTQMLEELLGVEGASALIGGEGIDMRAVRSRADAARAGRTGDSYIAAVMELRRKGCTCKPTLTADRHRPGDFHAEHQPGCALPLTEQMREDAARERGEQAARLSAWHRAGGLDGQARRELMNGINTGRKSS